MAVNLARRVRPSLRRSLIRRPLICRPLIRVASLGVVAATAGAAVLVAPSLALATPSPSGSPTRTAATTGTSVSAAKPKPTIVSVQKQLGALAVTNSQLVEQFDAARIRVTRLQTAATVAARQARAARAAYARANVIFTQVVQAQYETGGISAGSMLLDSGSGTGYLDRLSTMNLLSDHDAAVVTMVRRAHRVADTASRHASTLLTAATAQRDTLAGRKTSVTRQIRTYRALLARLNSAQRAAYLRAQNPTVTSHTLTHTVHHLSTIPVTATTAGARAAIRFALAQVGKPYVWGASGPGSYDCSGLTMRSWQHGGVTLPHSAADQYNYGHHVTRSQLQPGDLIFFYQPIGHVTIYIGNGLMVSAPTAGQNVSVVPLDAFNSDYTGATRLT